VSLAQLLAQLDAAGVRLQAAGERLRYDAPPGAVTPALRAALLEHKAALLDQLRAAALPGLPLSAPQRSLWFLESLYPGDPSAAEQFVVTLRGAVDGARLARAWQAVVAAHPLLRTRFIVAGDDVRQQPGPPTATPDFRSVALPDDGDAALAALAVAELARPFDLKVGRPVRAVLAALADGSQALVVTAHHLVADGLSVTVIRDDLARAYAGNPPPATDDDGYFAWAAALPAVDPLARDAWVESLRTAPLAGLGALPRPAAAAGRRSVRVPVVIPPDVAAAVRGLARAARATPFMVLLAAFRVLLARCTGESDLLIGTPLTLRDGPQSASIVGCLVNPVVLRTPLAGLATFADVVASERATVLAALDRRGVPFADVVAALKPPRRLAEHPLFQVLFSVEPGWEPLTADGVEFGLTTLPVNRASYFDLEVGLRATADGGYAGHIGFATARVEEFVGGALGGHYARLLAAAVAAPAAPLAQLTMLTPEGLHQVTRGWQGAATGLDPGPTLVERFLAQAAATPAAVALRAPDGTVCYGELAARVASLAVALVARGVGPGVPVGVALPRSAELVIAMLAVLRAGGVLLPLDPGYPAARRAFILADAGAALLLAGPDDVPAGADGPALLAPADWPAPATGDAGGADAPAPLPLPDATAPACLLYTSGSTGEPKGAVQPHGALARRVAWLWDAGGFSRDDVFSLRSSPNFIDCYWEVFGALANGAALVVVPAQLAGDAERLPAFLAETCVTHLVLVPSLLRALLAEDSRAVALRGLRLLISSGEPLDPALARRVRALLPHTRLLNTYGTSEIWDAAWEEVGELPADALRVPIGRPLPYARCYVLDAGLAPQPVGIPGELWVGGDGLGDGYWRRPGLTAERFRAVPGLPDARLYRTGDAARFLPDGRLEILGRIDGQVKLRGLRLEPGEVESVLRAQPFVGAAGVAVAGEGEAARLVAGVVPEVAGGVDLVALRASLRTALPAWMVPVAIAELVALPLTPSGKLDRRTLAELCAAAPAGAACHPPRAGVEAELAGLWCELLATAAVGRDDDFFDLGGHSLLAARLVGRCRARFGVPVELRDLFAAPTLAGLAAVIAARRGAAVATALERLPRDRPLALAPAQERLWFLDQLDPASPAYNVAFTVRLQGAVDAAALDRALVALVTRHELLRARVVAEAGVPRLVIDPPPATVLGRLPAPSATAPTAAVLVAAARAPFDLARGPLFRAGLLVVAEDDQRLLLVVHHIVTDATSNHVLFAELAALYAATVSGAAAALPTPAAGYPEYAARQAATLPDAAALDWWRGQLAGAPALLALPTDRPRPAEQRFQGAWVQCPLPGDLVATLRATARRERTTTFVLLLAAFAVWLRRLSGQSDLLVGTPVEGRLDAEHERTVGLFINSVVLRLRLAGEPGFADFATAVAQVVRAAQTHQAVPFERLVQALQPERSLARSPVFQVLFNQVRVPARELPAGPVRLCLDELIDHGVAAFDLALTVADETDGITVTFEYATDLFDRSTVAGWATQYLTLLAAALADPGTPVTRLPLLDATAQAAMLAELAPAVPAAIASAAALPVTLLVADQARRDPGAEAARRGDEVLSYGDLDSAATHLACRLRAAGVGPGDRIGIGLPRSPGYLVAVLGVLKSGAAYVPLDPGYPEARLAWLIGDAGLRLVIGAAALGAAAAGTVDPAVGRGGDFAAADLPPPDPDSTAYLLYTSGSSGKPKGVMVSHRNLAATAAAWRATWPLRPGQVHLQMASSAFDVFTGDWVRALTSGGRLLFCPRETLLDAAALLDLWRSGGVQVAEFVPAVIRGILDELDRTGAGLPPIELLIVGSDTWHRRQYARLRARAAAGTRVINSYGVAEATIDSSWFEASPDESLDDDRPLPIGRPFPGTRLYVLDEHGGLLPDGVPGELWVAGTGVAQGYWQRPAETAARFRADPFVPGGRAYRTGDGARRRPDGQFELLGRLDGQVKLRGFRIEPGEIEAALLADPRVTAAAVVLRTDPGRAAMLVGYCTLAAADGDTDAAALLAGLRTRLPDYLVPAALVVLPALPCSPNGKVDRAALPMPSLDVASTARAPATALEAEVAAQVATLLGLPAVAPDADFFALGGHSLLAARLVARLRERFRIALPLRCVFEAPTPAGLAARIELQRAAGLPAGPALVPRPPGARVPLSLPQQRLWFLHRLQPGSSAYHIQWSVRLLGEVDRVSLQGAVDAVVSRHESLRTVFVAGAEEGTAEQQVLASVGVPVEWLAAPGLDDEGVAGLLAALARRPFDLGRGPLLRLTVLATGPGEQVLVVVIHHIVADGWSLALLATELSSAYAALRSGGSPAWSPLPLQYGDWALWQRQWLAGPEPARQLAYWREALAGAPPVLDLQGDLPRPAQPAGRGAWQTVRIDAALVRAVESLALQSGCTPYMVLLAAYALLLGRYGGTEDVVVGTPVAGRGQVALEGLIGFFVNTLVLRVGLGGNPTVAELLGRVRGVVLGALEHQDLPFEKLVEVLNPPRSLSHPPLLQVLFVYHSQPPATLRLDGLEVRQGFAAGDAVKLDLALHVGPDGDGLVAAIGYDTDLFTGGWIGRFAADWLAVLRGLVTTSDGVGGIAGDPATPRLRAVPAIAAPGPGEPIIVAAELLDGLRDLWRGLLGRSEVADDDDFFALGGHSLLALRLLARIQATFGVELPPIAVFEQPTLRGLAARVAAGGALPAAAAQPIPRRPRSPRP
jgi:amino acid adenylation domain-containing protein